MKRSDKAKRERFHAHRAALADARLKLARALFRDELPLALKRQLTVEIAMTRGEELKRAYPGLKSVTAGFRLCQGEGSKPRVVDEPCVVFIVARKRRKEDLARRAMLPSELLCHVEFGGVRRLCAVPTDVDAVSARGGIALQGAIQPVEVTPPAGGEVKRGVMACAIARRNDPGAAYLVSCRHVLGVNWDRPPERTNVRLPGKPTVIAEASFAFFGRLSASGISCDVQLATVRDAAGGRAAVSGAVFTGVALESEAATIPKELFILTPRGPIAVHFNNLLSSDAIALPYKRTDGSTINIAHETLIETVFDGEDATRDGDSGSPLATTPDGGRLVGMHIARNIDGDGRRAYAIPAWEMLSPDNYDPEAAGEIWTLMRPSDIQDAAEPPAELGDFLTVFKQEFGKGATAAQLEGMTALLECWADMGPKDQDRPVWLAYVLASCWHETGGRMQPVRETFETSDERVIAVLNDMFAKGKLSSRYWDPVNGRSYYGRGLIQITHAGNYAKLGEELGLGQTLVENPDLALDMTLSAKIAVIGMLKGLFTNKRLADFAFDTDQSWVKARAIVNGSNDRAAKIAEYGKKFLRCLTASVPPSSGETGV